MTKNKLLIIDYNLTRYDDAKAMIQYAKEKYDLETILIRGNPTDVDYALTPHVINLFPRDNNFVLDAIEQLQPFMHELRAGLVFSDDAIYSGSQLLNALGLEVDSAELAESAFSKRIYRENEQQIKKYLAEQAIFVPDFNIIHTLEEVREFSEKHPNGFVLKPSCEGNNRGVLKLNAESNLEEAMNEVASYIHEGVICEELIDYAHEYSYDGLGYLEFITEKLSLNTRYPVEFGQIVPARLNINAENLIKQTGRAANLLVGQKRGPFHNEIKLNSEQNKTAVIEPNRRPAGMKIWDLAGKVFGLNFYHLWIDQVMGNDLPITLPEPKGYAAIRLLGSPKDGILQLPELFRSNPLLLLEKLKKRLMEFDSELADNLNWFDFKLTKKNNDRVFKIPRDNSYFLAQIFLVVDDAQHDIINILDIMEKIWLSEIEQYIGETE